MPLRPVASATKCPSLLIWLSLAMELSERPPRARRRILLRVGLGRVGGLEMSASTGGSWAAMPGSWSWKKTCASSSRRDRVPFSGEACFQVFLHGPRTDREWLGDCRQVESARYESGVLPFARRQPEHCQAQRQGVPTVGGAIRQGSMPRQPRQRRGYVKRRSGKSLPAAVSHVGRKGEDRRRDLPVGRVVIDQQLEKCGSGRSRELDAIRRIQQQQAWRPRLTADRAFGLPRQSVRNGRIAAQQFR